MHVYQNIGNVCNFYNILTEKAFCNCEAMSDVEVLAIPIKTLQALRESNGGFEEQVYKGAGLYFVQQYEEKAYSLRQLTEEKINKLFFNSQFEKVEMNSVKKYQFGAYVFQGEFLEQLSEENALNHEPKRFANFTYLEAGEKEYVAKKQSLVCIFKDPIVLK